MTVGRWDAERVYWSALPLLGGACLLLAIASSGPRWWMPIVGIECAILSSALAHFRAGADAFAFRRGNGFGNALTMAFVAAAMLSSIQDPRSGASLPLAIAAMVAGLVVLTWTLRATAAR